MAKKQQQYSEADAFYRQLWHFYQQNKGSIRKGYKQITKKLLDYNDRKVNPEAFLRPPQFEAFEMYVFVKEYLGNEPMHRAFDEWRHREGKFTGARRYVPGQGTLFDVDEVSIKQTSILFKQMKEVSENYPNYIFALTMGLGKTILMATCIFYEFLLANKFPKDSRFCHNALVFAPDRTVLQSLREIETFDKAKVVPPEYVAVIDQNLRIHFLEDTATTLHAIDNSDFNLIISNDQKIITKRRHTAPTAADELFAMPSGLLSTVYGEEEDDAADALEEGDLIINQRFAKLCRLRQIGVYVDEAHHLFGNALKKELTDKKNENGLRRTINLLDETLRAKGSSVVGCYNFTGTPYVKNQVLPDVLYAYGLADSINMGYLKRCRVLAYENVKCEGFLRQAITEFWEAYGEEKREGLLPKLAIFASRIDEVESEVRPSVEKVLAELGIDADKVLVNTGDPKQTKAEDIHLFNNLDNPASEGNSKQFVILVGKGREGWNCRSLFGVALYREPKSKIFVLQATMRCLRQIGRGTQRATVFLSKENYDTLDSELNKNFNMKVKDLSGSESRRRVYHVRMVPPEKKIRLNRIRRSYQLEDAEPEGALRFGLADIDMEKYESHVIEKADIAWGLSAKEQKLKTREEMAYNELSLVGEVARLLGPEVSCLTIEELIEGSEEGLDTVLDYVNRRNALVADRIAPTIFRHLFRVKVTEVVEEGVASLLRQPKDSEYYEFSALPELVALRDDPEYEFESQKSFHADTYCFDSKPEKELFNQLIHSDDVEEVYFTGMFTAGQSDLAIQYVDPDSYRIRNYYPDFYVKNDDGSVELVEVKGDNKVDDATVKAKELAARSIAAASHYEYALIGGNFIMENDVTQMSFAEAQKRSLDLAHGFVVDPQRSLSVEFDSNEGHEE